jgi:hypothetical protein
MKIKKLNKRLEKNEIVQVGKELKIVRKFEIIPKIFYYKSIKMIEKHIVFCYNKRANTQQICTVRRG